MSPENFRQQVSPKSLITVWRGLFRLPLICWNPSIGYLGGSNKKASQVGGERKMWRLPAQQSQRRPAMTDATTAMERALDAMQDARQYLSSRERVVTLATVKWWDVEIEALRDAIDRVNRND